MTVCENNPTTESETPQTKSRRDSAELVKKVEDKDYVIAVLVERLGRLDQRHPVAVWMQVEAPMEHTWDKT